MKSNVVIRLPFLLGLAFGLFTAPRARAQDQRSLPAPLPGHPGNIFLFGQEVTIPVPGTNGVWGLWNYEGQLVKTGAVVTARAGLGKLPVGFYRVDVNGNTNVPAIGVLAPLKAPTPTNSPIGVDVAMAWFYPPERMAQVANLCALAGVNWVRDRLNWAEMEPQKGQFASSNRYDVSAWEQGRAGLRVLQVIHLSPGWANPNTKRFPLDLRDAYGFYEAMARRWPGEVQAFEPWNEADIPMFGGHAGSEIASLQKAAYLGLKAGNPQMVVCQNVFALHNPAQLQDFQANDAWPYFDTFNLHHYAAFEQYPKLYGEFRAVSGGRPLWVTECSLPVKWSGNASLKEPTEADLRVQSERVAKTFACSLYQRAAATFYFLLPHYAEGQTQFGILHPDLTPRPAFLALAAVGHLLAGAQPLGKLNTADKVVQAYLFEAGPDGHPCEVLVAWTDEEPGSVELPERPLQVFDHLGRSAVGWSNLKLTAAPVFALLPSGTAKGLPLISPPVNPARVPGTASQIVLQALWPEDHLDLNNSAYRVSTRRTQTIPVFAYNFGSAPVHGKFRLELPDFWKGDFPPAVEIAAQQRVELALTLSSLDAAAGSLPVSARIVGDFGTGGQPVLSIRVVPEN